MKRKDAKKEIKNFGVINLNEVDFAEDTLEVFIPIESVSDDLQKRIDAEVEKVKVEYLAELRQRMPEGYANGWSKKGITVDFISLHITVKKKVFSYALNYDFTDKENEFLWSGVVLEVDLSEYEQELKKTIAKAVIDKFF